jgi:hypothetical protein
MSMAAFKMENRMSRFLATLIEKKLLNAGTLVIRYIEQTLPDNFNPNKEADYPTTTPKSVTVGALIYEVSARTTLRQYSEIQAGDLIVTFEAEPIESGPDGQDNPVDIDALTNARFEWMGMLYVQQAVGKELASFWEDHLGGQPVAKTILLRRSQ